MTKGWIEKTILLTLAVLAAADGSRIIGGHSSTFGAIHSGGYLILLGLLIGGLTVFSWLRGEPERPPSGEEKPEKGGIPRQVVLCLAILAGSSLLIPWLGYMLSTVIFFLAYFRFLGGYRGLPAFLWSAALGVLFAYVFTIAGMMLPQGPISWP
ncbi:MAG: tripartite tricarboxylate transporter TctB family protein [Thermodesulfobacteriota bacterium]